MVLNTVLQVRKLNVQIDQNYWWGEGRGYFFLVQKLTRVHTRSCEHSALFIHHLNNTNYTENKRRIRIINCSQKPYINSGKASLFSKQNFQLPKGSYLGNLGCPALKGFQKNEVKQVAQRQIVIA